jgi:hypothetical protein
MPVRRAATHAARIGAIPVLTTAGEVVKALWPLIQTVLQDKIDKWLKDQAAQKKKKTTRGSIKKSPTKKTAKKAPANRARRK